MPKLFTLKPEFKDPPPATQPQNFKSNQHTPHKKRICRSFRPDPSPERRRWLKEWGPGGAFTPSMLKWYQGFNESRRSLTRSLSLSLSYTHRMGRGKEEVAMVVPATGRLLERRVAIGVREGEGAGEGGWFTGWYCAPHCSQSKH